MSIASEISRLQTAKADLKTAIEGKGVTVSSSATLDEYADLVDAIVAGGGGYSLDDIISGAEPSGALVSNATSVRRGFASYSTAITSVTMPNVTLVRQDAFSYNSKLKYVYFGGQDMDLGNYAVRQCTGLEEIRIPRWKATGGFGGFGLQYCNHLRLIDYGYVNTAAFNTLSDCPLDTVILRKDGVATLPANALDNSKAFKQGGTGGTVYVPRAQIENYKVASNWSTYYGYGTMTFAAIEGSEYEL